jgi:glycosyltransferase involved in cell wall biosynthesis
MVAGRLLGIPFSMTLHGSDLLLNRTYLDVKLAHCAFCMTVSEYNRRYVLEHYPELDPSKVIAAHLGVEVRENAAPAQTSEVATRFNMLAVGRLHAVKNHAFLVRACASLRARGIPFECMIAGEGTERRRLETLIRDLDLTGQVSLLGHIPREQMDSLYARADIALLTSRSEGIPLVLMEAMARGKIVLAPAITGIPELVIPGKTGFLYEPGSMDDFLAHLLFVRSLLLQGHGSHPSNLSDSRSSGCRLDWMRHAARIHVQHNFNRKKNLELFAELFLRRISPKVEANPHANLVLQ